MLQMFGQMMMMPISMATAGMNMMAAPFGGARGDGRAGGNGALGRWLGGCCGSREGPGGRGEARSLDARGAGWTAQGGRGGSGNPGLASGYRSGSESRPSGEYRAGTESRPSSREYREGTESQPRGDYRSGNESTRSIESRSGTEARSGYGSGARSDRGCGCGKRSGGGGSGSGSVGTRSHDHYPEERRMSDRGCCDDNNNRFLKLVEYWVVNVKYCPDPPDRSAFLGHEYQSYTDQFDECNLETWLLGQWLDNPENRRKVPPGQQKYLRIKVNHIGEWRTVDDCCPREVDVLRSINETLRQGFGQGAFGGGGGGGGYAPSGGGGYPAAGTGQQASGGQQQPAAG